MPKITKIVNGEYIGGDKYKITDVGGGKSKVEFSPDNVLTAGTPVGSEILNEVQNNCLYEVVGTKVTEGQEEIYNCNLEGLDTFTFTSLRLLVSFNLSNTKNNPFLRIGGIKYQLKSKGQNILIGNIVNNQKSLVEIARGSGLANFIDSNYVLPLATPTAIGGSKLTQEQLTKTNDTVLSSTASNSLMNNGAGAIIQGYIEDGGVHLVGEVWLSKNNIGEFECKVANTDDYVESTKWEKIDDKTNADKLDKLTYNSIELVSVPNYTSVRFERLGNIAILTVDTGTGLANASNNQVLFKVPQQFIPKNQTLLGTLNSSYYNARIKSVPTRIESDGSIRIYSIDQPIENSAAYYGMFIYSLI